MPPLASAEHERPSLTLEEVVLAGGAASHKLEDVDGSLEITLPEQLISVTGELIDPATQGGCFELGRRGVYYTLRHPSWRSKEGDEKVRKGDVMVLHGLDMVSPIEALPPKGKEVEWFAIGEDGKDRLVSGPDDPHPELFGFQGEDATSPYADSYELGLAFYSALISATGTAHEHGARLYSGSNLAHRPMTVQDINKHPYVLRVAAHLDTLREKGRLDARELSKPLAETAGLSRLDGSAAQLTVGNIFPYEESAMAANAYSAVLAPLTMHFTASSPFSAGKERPGFPKPYDTIQPADGLLAARYYGRELGSFEAGPLVKPFPLGVREFLALTHERMRDGVMPGPGRTGGQHRDVRLRPDHGPYGAVEYGARDTSGWHIQTNLAMALLEQAHGYVIAKAHLTGDIERLAKQYPWVASTQITEEHLLQAKINSAILAQDLPDTKIKALNAEEVSPSQQWSQMLIMIEKETAGTAFALPQEAVTILTLRSYRPTIEMMRKDDDGFVDMSGFYDGMLGTLAHYQKALCRQLLDKMDITEEEAIAEVQFRTAIAFEAYLRKFNPEYDLAFLRRMHQ